jgi:uncharacterized membrane protein
MNETSQDEGPRRPVGTVVGMVTGAAAVVVLGGLGAAVWLRWLWSRTPPSVRSTVPVRHRQVAVCLVWGTFVFGILGWAMTVRGLVRAFGEVANIDPSEKAKVLAMGISEAMNATVAGIVVQLLGCVLAIALGWSLLRRTASLVPRGE